MDDISTQSFNPLKKYEQARTVEPNFTDMWNTPVHVFKISQGLPNLSSNHTTYHRLAKILNSPPLKCNMQVDNQEDLTGVVIGLWIKGTEGKIDLGNEQLKAK